VSEADVTGGCLCGAVRFVARGEPVRTGMCNCTVCRKNCGSAYFAFAVFEAGQVEITGELKGHTAMVVDRRFCPACGSLVCLDRPGKGEHILAIGAFDAPPPWPPQYELFMRSRLDWLPRVAGVVRYTEYRDAEPIPD
jgi:hypothetical protein